MQTEETIAGGVSEGNRVAQQHKWPAGHNMFANQQKHLTANKRAYEAENLTSDFNMLFSSGEIWLTASTT